MRKYEDMLHLPRPSSRRPKMPRQDRAKIFAPFAALNGHDGAIYAKEQVLIPQIEKTAYGEEILNEALRMVKRGDTVSVTWFCPVEQRQGETVGIYRTLIDQVECVNIQERVICLGGQRISFDNLEKLKRIS